MCFEATMLYYILIFSVAALALLILNFHTIKERVRIVMALGKLPGPPKQNLIEGNIGILRTTPDEIFRIVRKWGLQYFPIYKVWFILESAANIYSPEDVEMVLSNPKHINKSKVYNIVKGWLKNGLLTSGDEKWQHRRKILTPAFHFNILQQFIIIFNEQTDQLVDNLKRHVDKPYVEVNEIITQFTLKSIAETAMGTQFDFKSQREKQYKQAIFEIGEVFVHKITRPWLFYEVIRIVGYLFYPGYYFKELKLIKSLQKFTSDIIKERQSNFDKVDLTKDHHDVYRSKKRLAMLDLLINIKNEEGAIDEDGIREEVDTFLFEGHDTTTSAICFALMLIARHKNVQDKIVEEMRYVLDDIHKKPSFHDLQQLKYLERVIKEVLRLYPSVHYISRQLGEDMTSHHGYLIPKGSVVHIHIYDLHHNPNVYPDPEKFDPDRFLPENLRNQHPYAYIPFSAGPRNCIGQKFAMLEIKALLCGILSYFILEPVDTPESIVPVVDMVLRTKEPIKVKFVNR